MPLFPPVPVVAIAIDGRPIAQYERAYLEGGHVYAPVVPTLYFIADRVWTEGSALIAQRGGRRVRVPLRRAAAGGPAWAYVAIAAVARGLGERVTFQKPQRILEVRRGVRPEAGAPWSAQQPQPRISPRDVFTPEPVATVRPQWTGPPLPRRTPLLVPPRRPR